MIVLTEAEIERFWSKVGRGADEECWPWEGGRFTTGYGAFKVRITRNNMGAHRIMCKLVHGVEPEVVMHQCDNPWCVNPAHLIPGTSAMNTRDAAAKGRMARGERSPHAKLTDDSVREIVALLKAGERQCVIAKRYGVNRNTIERIVHGKSWAHITGGPTPRPAPVYCECQVCGALVQRIAWQLKFRKHVFCSISCYRVWQRSPK